MDSLIIVAIVAAVIGAVLANKKGRSAALWAVLCFLIPLLVLVIAFLPALPKAGVTRFCKHCLSLVPWEATACAKCGRDIPPPVSRQCKHCLTNISETMEKCPACNRPAPWAES